MSIKIGLAAVDHQLGYARVSTANQKTDNQVSKLRDAGCSEVFEDPAVSGKNNHEGKQFRALMNRVRELRDQGEEVMVCVVKLDRFSRSLLALLEGVEALGKIGASFVALDDAFVYDATSPMNKLQLQMLGALAEFERSLIRGRLDEGMEIKVGKGLLRGPKPKLSAAAVKAIRASHATEVPTPSPGKLSKEWGVSRSTIVRVLELPGYKKPYTTLDDWEAGKAAANA